MNVKLIRFKKYINRGCDIDSLFTVNDSEYRMIEKFCREQKLVDLGDCSIEYHTLNWEEFDIVSDDLEVVTKFDRLIPNGVGRSIIGAMRDTLDEE